MKLLSLLALTLLMSQCLSLPVTRSLPEMETSRDRIRKRDAGNELSASSDASTQNEERSSDAISRDLQATPEGTTSTPAPASNTSNTSTTPATNEPTNSNSTDPTTTANTCPPLVPVQPHVDLKTATANTKLSALHTSQAARNLRQHLLLNGSEPDPQPPCFLIERQVNDQRTHPRIDYEQRFKEDYNSVKGYCSYVMLVERAIIENTTSEVDAQYSIRFTDLTTSLTQLKDDMLLVLQIISPEVYGEEESSAITMQPDLQDYCYDTNYDQQIRSYHRLSILSGYIKMDIIGLLDTVKK